MCGNGHVCVCVCVWWCLCVRRCVYVVCVCVYVCVYAVCTCMCMYVTKRGCVRVCVNSVIV